MNLELRAESYGRLAQAAEQVALRPTQLARLLVLRGVDEMLRSS